MSKCGKCKDTRIVDDGGLMLVEAITGGLIKANHPPIIYPCPSCCLELHNKVSNQYIQYKQTIKKLREKIKELQEDERK